MTVVDAVDVVGGCLPPTGAEPQAAVKGDARPCMAWKGEASTPAPPNTNDDDHTTHSTTKKLARLLPHYQNE